MATRKSPSKTPAARKAAPKTSGTAAKPRKMPRTTTTSGVTPAPPPASTAKAMRRQAPQPITAEQRYLAIAHAAYLRAEKRGFAPGHEVEDWLAAEAEFDAANRSASR